MPVTKNWISDYVYGNINVLVVEENTGYCIRRLRTWLLRPVRLKSKAFVINQSVMSLKQNTCILRTRNNSSKMMGILEERSIPLEQLPHEHSCLIVRLNA